MADEPLSRLAARLAAACLERHLTVATVESCTGGLVSHAITEIPGAIDLVTMYVPPEIGETLLDGIASKQPGELWINPGADSPRLLARAEALGLHPVVLCSIFGIGEAPSAF